MKLRCSALAAVLVALAWPAVTPAACPEGVELHGVFYVGVPAPDTVKPGHRVRGGVRPGCNDYVEIDENGEAVPAKEPDRPIEMRRIRGVPARIAVLVPDRPGRMYVARGFLPQLRSHPLHRAIYGAHGADERGRRECGEPQTVRGRLPWQPGFDVVFRVDHETRHTIVTVDALTRVRGAPRVAGTPHFRRGDAVAVTGRPCHGSRDTLFVADRIRVRRDA